MKNPKSNASLLSEAHVVDFLLLIYSKKEAMATEMRAVLKNYYGIVQVARKLEEAGLIEIEVVSTPRVSHIYRLTRKGKEVAEKLRDIEDILCTKQQ